MRWTLWLTVTFSLLCFLGIPSFFAIEILPTTDNFWLTCSYFIYDLVFPQAGLQFELITGDLVNQPLDILSSLSGAVSIGLVSLLVSCWLILVYIIWHIDTLFSLYANGQVFTAANARCFKLVGYALLCYFAVNAVGHYQLEQAFISIYEVNNYNELLTNNVEQSAFEDDISFEVLLTLDVSMLLSGLFMILVARVMNLATFLQAESDATI